MPADARPSTLLDTGAALAILNDRDPWHEVCIETFRQLRLPLLTSEAVLTELFHLFGRFRGDSESAWTFIRSGALALAAIAEDELPRLHELMSRYSDRPMDFADATLVYLAERESISTIFTVDHADFSTYRIAGRRRFRVLPLDRPKR
jgi:predicted nucleic acid-binding protein